MTKKQEDATPLFTAFCEISAVEYAALYRDGSGQEHQFADTAARIGKAVLNRAATDPGKINPGDRLLVSIFEGRVSCVIIERASTVGGVSLLRGRVEGAGCGYFLMSVKGEQVMAVIDLIDESRQYLLSYCDSLQEYCLYELERDTIGRLEDGPCLKPPGRGESI